MATAALNRSLWPVRQSVCWTLSFVHGCSRPSLNSCLLCQLLHRVLVWFHPVLPVCPVPVWLFLLVIRSLPTSQTVWTFPVDWSQRPRDLMTDDKHEPEVTSHGSRETRHRTNVRLPCFHQLTNDGFLYKQTITHHFCVISWESKSCRNFSPCFPQFLIKSFFFFCPLLASMLQQGAVVLQFNQEF